MKYKHWVRHNGIDYAPGAEVPNDKDVKSTSKKAPEASGYPVVNAPEENKSTDEKQEKSVEDSKESEPKEPADPVPEVAKMDKAAYEKLIGKADKSTLLEICKSEGIETTEDATNSVIIAAILEKMYG